MSENVIYVKNELIIRCLRFCLENFDGEFDYIKIEDVQFNISENSRNEFNLKLNNENEFDKLIENLGKCKEIFEFKHLEKKYQDIVKEIEYIIDSLSERKSNIIKLTTKTKIKTSENLMEEFNLTNHSQKPSSKKEDNE